MIKEELQNIEERKLSESTEAYGKSLEKIANDKKLKMISKKDRDTLKRLASLMKEEKLDELGGFNMPDMSSMEDSYVAPKRDTSGGMQTFYRAFSSPEAKKIVDGRLKQYVTQLRKIEGMLIKDWMSAAKSGAIDFFDLMRGFNTGDVQRAHKYEVDFLSGLLTKDKIQNRFRSYFRGKKGKPRKDDKWGK